MPLDAPSGFQTILLVGVGTADPTDAAQVASQARPPGWASAIVLGVDPAAPLELNDIAGDGWIVWADAESDHLRFALEEVDRDLATASPQRRATIATEPTGSRVVAVAIQREWPDAIELQPDLKVPVWLALSVLAWRALCRSPADFCPSALQRLAKPVAEPPVSFWSHQAVYGEGIEQAFEHPLREALQHRGKVPSWLASQVLQHLRWYFVVDSRERAPTMQLRQPQSADFHAAVGRVISLLDSNAGEAPDEGYVAAVEALHALKSYTGFVGHTRPRIDHYDHDSGLCRISYYVHGTPPQEAVRIDGQPTPPAYAKYRGCRFFHRLLFRQRIAWYPIAEAGSLVLNLNGDPNSLGWGNAFRAARISNSVEASVGDRLDRVRENFCAGKGGQITRGGFAAWRARLLKGLARFLLFRRQFNRAWVLVDRDVDADDNAEHLCRWICRNRPDINAWFLLRTESPDWSRLQAEGFRLVPPGLKRKLLFLNSEHIVSSHADFVFGGLDRVLYGDSMQWKATFLQHGVIKDDLSHWLGPREFDLFVTSSPAEHASIVEEDTPYPYTERETVRSGLPRHDHLVRVARECSESERRLVVVMPTWRGSLVNERLASKSHAEQLEAVVSSNYATQWRAFLRSEALRDLLARQGHTLVFLPHANAIPFLEAFDFPPHVEVAHLKGSMQSWLARCSAFVTDYTSVAFDVALLRRGVFYFQFDREEFFGGGHNWRPGYFDYDRDGFGPAAREADELVASLTAFLERGCAPEAVYLERMQRAMPDNDEKACERTFEAILATRRKWLPVTGDSRRVVKPS